MDEINWPAISAIVIPNLGGIAGSFIVRKNISPWYDSLKKPDWRPPNWLFAPAWTTLYSGMGYGSYLVWRDGGGFQGPAKLPLIIYGSNLLFNWAWTPIFFGSKKLKIAFYEIQLVNVTAIGTCYLFYKINQNAGLLIVPYLMWMGLATALNYFIQKENPNPKIKEIKE